MHISWMNNFLIYTGEWSVNVRETRKLKFKTYMTML